MANHHHEETLDTRLRDVNDRLETLNNKFIVAAWIATNIPLILILVFVLWPQRMHTSISRQLEKSEFRFESRFQDAVRDLRREVRAIEWAEPPPAARYEAASLPVQTSLPSMAPEI